MTHTLDRLESTIRTRRAGDATTSYVARLSQQGRGAIAQKLGEEAVETVIAALTSDQKATISEAADLIFHLGILLADMDIGFADVMTELDRRDGVSGLVEKASRAKE